MNKPSTGAPGEVWVSDSKQTIQLKTFLGTIESGNDEVELWRVRELGGEGMVTLSGSWKLRTLGKAGQVYQSLVLGVGKVNFVRLLRLLTRDLTTETWQATVLDDSGGGCQVCLPGAWTLVTEPETKVSESTTKPLDTDFLQTVKKTLLLAKQELNQQKKTIRLQSLSISALKSKVAELEAPVLSFSKALPAIGTKLRFRKRYRFGRENMVCQVVRYEGQKAITAWVDGADTWEYMYSKRQLLNELEPVPPSEMYPVPPLPVEKYPLGTVLQLHNRTSGEGIDRLFGKVLSNNGYSIVIEWTNGSDRWRSTWSLKDIDEQQLVVVPQKPEPIESSIKAGPVAPAPASKFLVGTFWGCANPISREFCENRKGGLYCEVVKVEGEHLVLLWHGSLGRTWNTSWGLKEAEQGLVPYTPYPLGTKLVRKVGGLEWAEVKGYDGSKVDLLWYFPVNGIQSRWGYQSVEEHLVLLEQPLRFKEGDVVTTSTASDVWAEVVKVGPEFSEFEWHGLCADLANTWTNVSANKLLLPLKGKPGEEWFFNGEQFRLNKYVKGVGNDEEWEVVCICGGNHHRGVKKLSLCKKVE